MTESLQPNISHGRVWQEQDKNLPEGQKAGVNVYTNKVTQWAAKKFRIAEEIKDVDGKRLIVVNKKSLVKFLSRNSHNTAMIEKLPAQVKKQYISTLFSQDIKDSLSKGDQLSNEEMIALSARLKPLIPYLSSEALQEKYGEEKYTLLHLVCRYDTSDLIKKICEREDIGTLLEAQDAKKNTPFQYGCFYADSSAVVAQAIQQGKVSLEKHSFTQNNDGKTLLHNVCNYQNSGAVFRIILEKLNDELLLKALAIKDSSGKTPLHYIFRNRAEEDVRALFTKLPPNTLEKLLLEGDDHWGDTPLHSACALHTSKSVKVLFEMAPADLLSRLLKKPNGDNFTPFQYACASGANEIVQEFLDRVEPNHIPELLLQTPSNSTPALILAYQTPLLYQTRNIELVASILEKVKDNKELLVTLLFQENDQQESVIALAARKEDNEFLELALTMLNDRPDLQQKVRAYIAQL